MGLSLELLALQDRLQHRFEQRHDPALQDIKGFVPFGHVLGIHQLGIPAPQGNALHLETLAFQRRQQGVDRLLRIQFAFDRSAVFSCYVGRAVQHLQVGLAAEFLQCTPQCLCWNIQLDLLCLHIAGNRQRYRKGKRTRQEVDVQGPG